jgi:hypothetical protein
MRASALAAAARPFSGGFSLFCCSARPRQAATPKEAAGGNREMASLACVIEPVEFLGLSALVELDRASDGAGPGDDADAVSKAKVLTRKALADKLQEASLP